MAQPSHPSSTGLEEYVGRRHGALQHRHVRAHERIRALIAIDDCVTLHRGVSFTLVRAIEVADIYDHAIFDVVVVFL